MTIPRLSLTSRQVAAGVTIIRQHSADETYPLHCHDFGELFFISRGKGIHCINRQNRMLEKGTLVLIRPDDIHSFAPIQYFDLTMYSLGFPMAELQRALTYMDLSLADVPLPPHVTLQGGDLSFVERQLELLLHTPEAEKLHLFRTLLPRMLHLLNSSSCSTGGSQLVPPWLARLTETMRLRENYIIGLPRMKELCPYSQEHLGRMFRQHLKTTPTGYINTLRLEYAAELLLQGRHSVTDIAFMAGFNNLSYFYSAFRSTYGCSPRAYAGQRSAHEPGDPAQEAP